MSSAALEARLRVLVREPVPLPGHGATAERHARLFAVGREDLSLARLAEAHWDAVAILAEAGRQAEPNTIYGVWAAEGAAHGLRIEHRDSCLAVSGSKPFCSGAGLVDRVLVTVREPEHRMWELDLRRNQEMWRADDAGWQTEAFRDTGTATVHFCVLPTSEDAALGPPGWYLERAGFWPGACGPAACWAGGAAGLVDFALQQGRDDAHTRAHLGAIGAGVWAMQALLERAGAEIDANFGAIPPMRVLARSVRHLLEQHCTDILRRFARAYGPHPLAMHRAMARRYAELDLYLRQCHAERDLEPLGVDLREFRAELVE